MKRLLVFLVFVGCCLVSAQPRVNYVISFDNAVHHEAVVTATFTGLPTGTLEVRMSRSSPGRYAIHEFAKNVYNVTATDGDGALLSMTRPNPYEWDVTGHHGTVAITYTIYGDHADGTYIGVDETHAHMNMPSTFMWARGLDDAPITITFKVPKGSGWKVGTQLAPTSDPYTFSAPGLQYFMDCPTEVSNFSTREWTVSSKGEQKKFRFVIHHEGTDKEVETFVEMAKRIVVEEKAVYGELPHYDYGQYTFLADYLPYDYGDGMEHRNSTFIVSRNPLKTNAVSNLGTLAHEFFHSWNVERMRPKSLEPFNFEEANMSGELWFAEGFTSYYADMIMTRAGMSSIDRFANDISGPIDQVTNLPGRKYFSPVEMSMQAPFVDAATSIDAQNKENTFVSYYTFGEAIGTGLDLSIRSKFPGKTLDGFMRSVWAAHGRTEIPYTNEDLRKLLGAYTGNQGFADDFFRHYIYGHEVVDYKELLSHAGFLLRNEHKGKSGIGRVRINYRNGDAVIGSATLVGSPLYKAGLDRSDTLMSIDGRNVGSSADVDSVLAHHKPGETVKVVYKQRSSLKTSELTFAEDDRLEVVPYETAGLTLTDEMKQFRDNWLSSKAEEKYPELTKTCPTCKRSFPFKFGYCNFDGSKLLVVSE